MYRIFGHFLPKSGTANGWVNKASKGEGSASVCSSLPAADEVLFFLLYGFIAAKNESMSAMGKNSHLFDTNLKLRAGTSSIRMKVNRIKKLA